MPYAAQLTGFPDIPLLCKECEKDWRYFGGVMKRNVGRPGIPQGIINKEQRTVFVRQERHWPCENCRCKPKEGATVVIDGERYKVVSGQDSQFRLLADRSLIVV